MGRRVESAAPAFLFPLLAASAAPFLPSETAGLAHVWMAPGWRRAGRRVPIFAPIITAVEKTGPRKGG